MNVYMIPGVSLTYFKILKKSKLEIGYIEEIIQELFYEMREKYAQNIEKMNFEQIYWTKM